MFNGIDFPLNINKHSLKNWSHNKISALDPAAGDALAARDKNFPT